MQQRTHSPTRIKRVNMNQKHTSSELSAKPTRPRKYKELLLLSCLKRQSQNLSTSNVPDPTTTTIPPIPKPYNWSELNESEFLTDSSLEINNRAPSFCVQILSKTGFRQRSSKLNISSASIKDRKTRNQQKRKLKVIKKFSVFSCFSKKREDLDPSPWFTDRTS